MSNVQGPQNRDRDGEKIPGEKTTLLSRPFFRWLSIALAISAVIIQAALTAVVLRNDPAPQNHAAANILPTSGPGPSAAPAVATRGAPPAENVMPPPEPRPTPVGARPVELRSGSTIADTATAAATPETAQTQPTIQAPAQGDRREGLTGIALEVAAAELTLQSGQFDAVLDYGNGVLLASHASFDLGDGQREPRIHLTTTYTNADTLQRG
jgi:hypothetical protein